MANKIDLTTLAKEYAEGRISKEDFLYLHNMLSNPSVKQPTATKPRPPVLTADNEVRATPPARRPANTQTARPQTTNQTTRRKPVAPPPPSFGDFNSGGVSPAVVIPPPYGRDAARGGAVLGYVRRHHKEVVALLGTLGIFISMFYNKFQTPPPERGTTRVVMVKQAEDHQAPQLHSEKIKLVAQLMMDDENWNKELIKDFVVQWNKLTANEKATVKQTDWFYEFSSKLSQQIKTAKNKAKSGDVQAIYNQQALLGLADSLIFGDDRSMKELLAQTAQSNTPPTQQTSASRESQSGNTTTENQSVAVDAREKSESNQVAVIDTRSSTQSEASPAHVSRSEIENTLSQITEAVEDGSMKSLANLFADDDFTNRFASLDQVLDDYREMFATTKQRHLELSSFNWDFDNNDARGTAKYHATVKMKSANVNKDISGKLDITLHRENDRIYITNFTLKNKKIVASVSKNRKPFRSTLTRKAKPKHPTQAELQDLVTQYISAYETGDVDNLMNLFANATWTSGKSGLIEMKQNYENLFANTSGREVFIKNVQWRYKDDKALGTGDLVITMRRDDKVQTQKGKIRLVAERSRNAVQITQIFHILE